MDESNATCGSRLKSIGLENTVENRQAYRELLITTPGLGQYISGEPQGGNCSGLAGRQAARRACQQPQADAPLGGRRAAQSCGAAARAATIWPLHCTATAARRLSARCCACCAVTPAAAGAILFEETLFQDTRKGTSMVSELQKQVSSLPAHAHARGAVLLRPLLACQPLQSPISLHLAQSLSLHVAPPSAAAAHVLHTLLPTASLSLPPHLPPPSP